MTTTASSVLPTPSRGEQTTTATTATLSSPPFTSPKSTAALALSSLFHSAADHYRSNETLTTFREQTNETTTSFNQQLLTREVTSSSCEGLGGEYVPSAEPFRQHEPSQPTPSPSDISGQTQSYHYAPVRNDKNSDIHMHSSSHYPPNGWNPHHTRGSHHLYHDGLWDQGHDRFGIMIEASRRFAAYPSPPMQNRYPPHPQQMNHPPPEYARGSHPHEMNRPPPPPPPHNYVRDSEAAGLVTPTPQKRVKAEDHIESSSSLYSRKKKSLGVLCSNFMESYQSGGVVCIDRAAERLCVERRRIYDIINILESMSIVKRKCKNTYIWLGTEDLTSFFGTLQQKAIERNFQDAVDNGLVSNQATQEKNQESTSVKEKSLGRLSQQFLSLFLVGHKVVSLTQASDKILGCSSEKELADLALKGKSASSPKSMQAAVARGLKTKIRRLYDIANVFLALDLIAKSTGTKKPAFVWNYSVTPEEILKKHQSAAKEKSTQAEAMTSPVGTDSKLFAAIHQRGGAVDEGTAEAATAKPTSLFAEESETASTLSCSTGTSTTQASLGDPTSATATVSSANHTKNAASGAVVSPPEQEGSAPALSAATLNESQSVNMEPASKTNLAVGTTGNNIQSPPSATTSILTTPQSAVLTLQNPDTGYVPKTENNAKRENAVPSELPCAETTQNDSISI